ncbi:hypothetical protein [Amycolatopsis australiensis]|uniref:Tachylectin n=1 Tax=Amycolatopsis australiensis TaxID=546364 RepID=A0A1K1SRE1_9PSEU|nr:hypothetical protein [Amycolatopsis australiensis]SFW86788.1 hypothetical protein SAMN04489730_6504 [Amycolatopsis australiensis]
MRLRNVLTGIACAAAMIAANGTATAETSTVVTPKTPYGWGFTEIDTSGYFSCWESNASFTGYSRFSINTIQQWAGRALTTRVGPASTDAPQCAALFVSGDSLWEINTETSGTHYIGPGWTNARLIAALGGSEFIEVTDTGQLMLWTYTDNWHSQQIGQDWQNARLITGVGVGEFVEVTSDGRLVDWLSTDDVHWYPSTVGQGWGDAKFIAGVAQNRFTEVTYDGRLVNWVYDGSVGWTGRQVGQDWGNAALVG